MTPAPKSNPFARGLKPFCAARAVRPRGKRMLLRAILRQSDSELAIDTHRNWTDAVAYEVLAIGEEVRDVEPGEFVDIVAAAAEMIDDGEFVLVHSDDVACVLDPATLAAFEAAQTRDLAPDVATLPEGSALRRLMLTNPVDG